MISKLSLTIGILVLFVNSIHALEYRPYRTDQKVLCPAIYRDVLRHEDESKLSIKLELKKVAIKDWIRVVHLNKLYKKYCPNEKDRISNSERRAKIIELTIEGMQDK